MSDMPKEIYCGHIREGGMYKEYICTEAPFPKETKYIRYDEHEALKQSHAVLVEITSELLSAMSEAEGFIGYYSGYPPTKAKISEVIDMCRCVTPKAQQALSEAQSILDGEKLNNNGDVR